MYHRLHGQRSLFHMTLLRRLKRKPMNKDFSNNVGRAGETSQVFNVFSGDILVIRKSDCYFWQFTGVT